MIKCDCGQEITAEQDKLNAEIAEETKTPKLDMCDRCWLDYCHHAVTGD